MFIPLAYQIWKTRQYLTKASVSSKYIIEPESIKINVILNWLSIVRNITHFILKCFIQFACTNLDGSHKEGGNFFNLLQKERGNQKGVPTLEETMRVKGQKTAQNEKQLHLSHAISQEKYSIWSWFLVHLCKVMISPGFFFFF